MKHQMATQALDRKEKLREVLEDLNISIFSSDRTQSDATMKPVGAPFPPGMVQRLGSRQEKLPMGGILRSSRATCP